ncbi:MAG: hypothetical protein Q8859_08935 [Bacteroidota bacterium]|nr:hypothetical protein [Bacteroidota bacterium]
MKTYDPQMHTAEHILNQTMVRMFGCGRSFSNHLERKKSKCDYRFNRALSLEEEKTIEKKVNEVISQNLMITEEFLLKADAERQFNLSKLPDETDDQIRIVRVGEYDACPCIGPHVSNTAQIGTFIMISSSCEEDVLRIRFKLNRPE